MCSRSTAPSACWKFWPNVVRPASARSPRTSACTSRRRSGCSPRSRNANSSSRPKIAESTASASASCGWPARCPANWTSPSRPAAVCEQLAAQLGETVNIAVRRSHFVVNIDQARGPSTVATHNWVGELTPLHATSSGKVLLAYMTPEERREHVGIVGACPTHPPHDHVATGTRGAGRGGRARRIRVLRRGTGGGAERRRGAGARPHRRRDRGAVAYRVRSTDSPKSGCAR